VFNTGGGGEDIAGRSVKATPGLSLNEAARSPLIPDAATALPGINWDSDSISRRRSRRRAGVGGVVGRRPAGVV